MKTSGRINKQIVISIGAGTLLIILYILIFSFSAQNADESGALSRSISSICVNMLNSLSGEQMSGTRLEQLIMKYEGPIRKLAHFTEYACMGTLVYVLWVQWMERGKKLYLLTIIWVAVSAAADEIHQLFVPGRDGNIPDVCLDTFGGAAGLLFCILVGSIFERRRRKKTRSGEAGGTPSCGAG